ncbi:MAG: hypothetical protein ACI8QY_000898, partial [bacterium]
MVGHLLQIKQCYVSHALTGRLISNGVFIFLTLHWFHI